VAERQAIDWSFFSMARYLLTADPADPSVLPASAGATQAGLLLARDLRPDASGRFEVLFGPSRRDGHWYQVVPGTSYLLSREFFADWGAAEPSVMQIECLEEPAAQWPAQGPAPCQPAPCQPASCQPAPCQPAPCQPAPCQPAQWPVLSADRVGKELEALGAWLVETVRVFAGAQARGIREFANRWDPQVSRPASYLPAIYHAYWDLRPGQGLLIETPVPRGGYWGIQLANGLWNTLDFANRQTSLNAAQAHLDPDGMFRAVISQADPGVANWLDTLGHHQGSVHLRLLVPGAADRSRPAGRLADTRDDWMAGWAEQKRTDTPADGYRRPAARVVALDELDAALPAGTARVTPAQRRSTLDERLRQVTRLQRS